MGERLQQGRAVDRDLHGLAGPFGQSRTAPPTALPRADASTPLGVSQPVPMEPVPIGLKIFCTSEIMIIKVGLQVILHYLVM